MIKVKNRWLLLLPVLLVYGIGMFVDVIEPDAAQYATMSVEMLKSGSYLEIHHRGNDYIDKPPLIFWTSALSFKLFGISNFSYKLPSVIFSLIGLFATYRLAKILYDGRTAFYSVLVLSSCQAWFLINEDVRTDTLLAACTIIAIWQLVEFNHTGRLPHIIYAALGIAGAMLAKGPIGIMVPALAIGSHFALKRQWESFFKWQWLLLICIVALCLLPMLYGLYYQFDLSPGKETYNGRIASGIKFYFWTQSFGRLTGESTWKNSSDPLFFLHTFLWAFLPWSFLFFVALWRQLRKIRRKLFWGHANFEAVTLGGTLLPGIALSFSHYKLPHYIFVVFPLAAILTAHYLKKLLHQTAYKKGFKIFRHVQFFVALTLIVIIVLLCSVSFAPMPSIFWLMGIGGIGLSLFCFMTRGSRVKQLFMSSFVIIVTINFLLNAFVYPALLTYQAESRISQRINAASLSVPFVGYRCESFSMDFFAKRNVPRIDDTDSLRSSYPGQTIWLWTDQNGYVDLVKNQITIIEQETNPDFSVSRLTLNFLKPSRRAEVVTTKYLLKVAL